MKIKKLFLECCMKIGTELQRESKWDYGYRLFILVVIIIFISVFVGEVTGG